MQSVDFNHCWRLIGTAEFRMSDGHIKLICFEANRTRFLVLHLILRSPHRQLSLLSSLPLDTPPTHPRISHPTRTGTLPASERAKVEDYTGPQGESDSEEEEEEEED
jgi:hypothetical protein